MTSKLLSNNTEKIQGLFSTTHDDEMIKELLVFGKDKKI